MTITIENATVRIADLLPPGGSSLAGIRARNVTFIGPAVLLLHGSIDLVGVTKVEGTIDSLLWDIADHRSSVMGAIDVKDGHFEDCRFMMIGFAGTHGTLSQLLGVTHVQPPPS